MLKKGLYEQVINKFIGRQLDDESLWVQKEKINEEEAANILSLYMTEVIRKGLGYVKEKEGLKGQIELCNNLISAMVDATGDSFLEGMSVETRAELLLALLDKQNTIYGVNKKARFPRPITSVAQSSLFTGAAKEPSMLDEFKREIASCDRIDMLVSFIKWSGLRLIMDELREFTQRGKKLRVITTSYMGATDLKAIEELRQLPNTRIKVSYHTKQTRLHAKTYIFDRDTGFSTAYVGSSNLSNVAISSGLEWNVKVTEKDLPDVMRKIAATFETYWNDREFAYYTENDVYTLGESTSQRKNGGRECPRLLF